MDKSLDKSLVISWGITISVFLFIGFMFYLLDSAQKGSQGYTFEVSEQDFKENSYYQSIGH